MRNRVDIQVQGTARGPTGGQSATGWNTVRTTWASIETIGQKEAYQADQFSAQVSHVITLRWSPVPDILPGMRVVYTQQSGVVHAYLVQGVDNVKMRNVKVKLLCLEINGGQ